MLRVRKYSLWNLGRGRGILWHAGLPGGKEAQKEVTRQDSLNSEGLDTSFLRTEVPNSIMDMACEA